MLVPNRNSSSDSYRYGFGGHEKDDEIKGEGNHYDFGNYGLDVRIGRRFQIDPMAFKYPYQSPYSTFNNNPLFFTDRFGLEAKAGSDDPGKGWLGRTWDKIKNFFSSDKSKVTWTNEDDPGEFEFINDEEPELFSSKWFSKALSFEGYKSSFQDTEFNSQRNIFLNSALPEMVDQCNTVREGMEYIPGADIIFAAGLDKSPKGTAFALAMNFIPFEKYVPKPVYKVADDVIYTAIGRMDDVLKFSKYMNVDTWHKSGRIPSIHGGGDVTWPENRKWIEDRIKRGDIFIMTMDPNKLPEKRIPGVPNGIFTKMEYELLKRRKATIIYDY